MACSKPFITSCQGMVLVVRPPAPPRTDQPAFLLPELSSFVPAGRKEGFSKKRKEKQGVISTGVLEGYSNGVRGTNAGLTGGADKESPDGMMLYGSQFRPPPDERSDSAVQGLCR